MIGIGLIAVESGKNTNYLKAALKAVDYWSVNYSVVVWTNKPEKFKGKHCTVITYTDKKFNFHDKLKLLEALTIDYEVSIVIDCNKIPDIDIRFNEADFEPGLHSPHRWFVHWEELVKQRDERNNCYWDMWDKEFKISEMNPIPVPICERVLALKRHNDFKSFLNLVNDKYKPVSTENDKQLANIDSHHKEVIKYSEGRAEGLSFILAAQEINFPVFCPSPALASVVGHMIREN